MWHFIHKILELSAGDMVEIYLTGPANVQLLDDENFELYRQGKPYKYEGGYATESPAQIEAPTAGRWHMTIDLGGGAGRVSANYRIIAAQPA